MQPYRVMLVDDEEDVRQAIARKLDWANLGFEVVGEAANGEEALELCELLEPDVVMTDIKMPFMDGLTLCRRLKQMMPGIKVAIFSGFDDFEYAKEAIKLEVEEYILKPIDADELADVFRRLRISLDKEITEKRDVERLQQYYEQSLPLIRQQFLSDLLDGQLTADNIGAGVREYGLSLDAEGYCVALIRFSDEDAAHHAEAQPDVGRARLRKVSVQHVVAESLGDSPAFQMITLADSLALLFLLPRDVGVKSVAASLGTLFPLCKKILGINLSIGIGKVYPRLESVCLSRNEAASALEYRVLVDSGQCMYIGDIEPGGDAYDSSDAAYSDEIIRQIKIGDSVRLKIAVGALVQHFKAIRLNMQQYQIFMLEMSAELLRLIRAYRLDTEGDDKVNSLFQRSVAQFENLDEMGRWLFDFCDSLRHQIRRERKDTGRLVIEKARAYMAEHYADGELSVDTLSGVLNLSPAYFSTLFKKETGLGFISYLTRLRMEKALEYLGTTDEKTYMIAEKVGYLDANYFSYVFKKEYGVSPSKYKTDRMKANDAGENSAG